MDVLKESKRLLIAENLQAINEFFNSTRERVAEPLQKGLITRPGRNVSGNVGEVAKTIIRFHRLKIGSKGHTIEVFLNLSFSVEFFYNIEVSKCGPCY